MDATPPNAIPLATPTPEQRRAAAARYQQASQFLIAGQPEHAAAILRYCCQLDPVNLIYRRALTHAQAKLPPAPGLLASLKKWRSRRGLRRALRDQDFRKVLGFADELLALDSTDLDTHLAIATAFQTVGLLDHAVAYVQQTHALLGRPAAITAVLIKLCEQTGRFGQARALASASAHDEPMPAQSFESALVAVGAELDALRHDAAIASQKLAEQPDNGGLQSIHSRLLQEIQARELELCRRQADRYPADVQGQLELGGKLLKAGQFEAALETLQKIQMDTQVGWRAVVYAGYCRLNLRQWRKAKPLFEQALLLMPADADTTRQELLRLLAQNAAAPLMPIPEHTALHLENPP